MKNITTATIKSIIKNGGATFNKNRVRVSLKSGYQVSIHDITIIPVEQLDKNILKQLILKLTSRGEYLGVWIDDGKAYIDISRRIATKAEAMKQGRDYKQLSILRWKDGACLAVE